MTAKEFLSQIKYLDHDIETRLSQIASLRTLAEKCTAVISDMPGADTRNLHGTEDTICRIIDYERELDGMIDELVNLKREADRMLNLMEDRRHRMVLEYRYCIGLEWSEIAVRLGCSPRWVYRLHDEALTEFEGIMKKSEKICESAVKCS